MHFFYIFFAFSLILLFALVQYQLQYTIKMLHSFIHIYTID